MSFVSEKINSYYSRRLSETLQDVVSHHVNHGYLQKNCMSQKKISRSQTNEKGCCQRAVNSAFYLEFKAPESGGSSERHKMLLEVQSEVSIVSNELGSHMRRQRIFLFS